MTRKKKFEIAARAARKAAKASAKPPQRGLLDGDSDSGGGSGEDAPALRINDAYAKRFQHNKEREELHRLQAKLGPQAAARAVARAGRGRGDDSDASDDDDAASDDSESSSDSEEPEVDDRFLETLLKIRRKDPSIYAPGAKLLPSSSEDDDEEEEGGEAAAAAAAAGGKKKKAVFLRDVQSARLLQRAARKGSDEDVGSESDESDEGGDDVAGGPELGVPQGPTYAQEQAALRAEFLAVAATEAEPEAGGAAAGGLRLKRRAAPVSAADAAAASSRSAALLSSLFEAGAEGEEEEEDDAPDDDDDDVADGDEAAEKRPAAKKKPARSRDAQADAFLKDYLQHKRWMADGSGDEGEAGGGSEDEVDAQEAFEAQYNFRFEEPGGAVLAAQPRRTEGTIRKVKSARADARKAKAERVAAEHAALREEVKRLKNLKRREIEDKLAQIRAVAGAAVLSLPAGALDAEFDEAEHDEAMGAAFGDDYYAEEEADEGAVTKPEFGDLDDELRELLEAEAAGGGGFAAAARRAAAAPPPGAGGDSSSSEEEAEEEADAAEAEEGGEDGEGGSRFSKRAMKKWRKQLESKLQEYYSLDCEDFVAGLPCRFRYKQVLPNKYGLKTEEILALTDKELNQVVSLKKLAPYREEDAKPKYGGKRERAEAALARLAASERAAAGEKRKKKRGDGEADDEAAAAAARARSFVAPTKKARREAAEAARAGPGAGAGPKLSKNAAKHAKRKAKKEAAGGGDSD